MSSGKSVRNQKSTKLREQILVLGMHRSGTSCVTQLLHLMGAFAGKEKELLGKNDENPRGFWERRDVRTICDGLLRAGGAKWWKPLDFRMDEISESTRRELSRKFKSVLSKLQKNPPWVLKEPRLCIVLPFFIPHLTSPVCVHVTRNPFEIADSLRKRNDFSLTYAIALWEYYNRHALWESAGLDTVFVS